MRDLTSADGVTWTFDTFVVSESSRGAFDMAVAVADGRTDTCNPLLIHGPVGSGKSHLLQAIAHRMRSQRPREAIVCTPAGTVIAQLTQAIRLNEVREFQRALVALDALLLDDFPRVRPGNEQTREAIFLTLEELLTQGVKVVVASSVPLAVIGPEPHSRRLFERAGVVELRYPERSARAEITRRSAAIRGVILPESAIDSIAEHCSGSPREIESAVARTAAEMAIAHQRN